MRSLNCYFLPALVDAEALADTTVVVIDVLRATTTVVHALAAGAARVVPCLEVADAEQAAASLPGPHLRGGERGGRKIPGFDLGNSPAEYSPDRVGGRTVIFTTTNGTRALRHAGRARRVLLGSFVNFSAVCAALREESQVALLCAGTDQQITREDVLLAGALADDVQRAAGDSLALNDQALLAIDAWQRMRSATAGRTLLADGLRQSLGGRNLLEIGYENDIEIAATLDKFDLVPEWFAEENCVRAAFRR